MTITLDLQPEIETTLLAQAHARGVTLATGVSLLGVTVSFFFPDTAIPIATIMRAAASAPIFVAGCSHQG